MLSVIFSYLLLGGILATVLVLFSTFEDVVFEYANMFVLDDSVEDEVYKVSTKMFFAWTVLYPFGLLYLFYIFVTKFTFKR